MSKMYSLLVFLTSTLYYTTVSFFLLTTTNLSFPLCIV